MTNKDILKELDKLMGVLDKIIKDPILKDYSIKEWIAGFRSGLAHMFNFVVQKDVNYFYKPIEDIRKSIKEIKLMLDIAKDRGCEK